MSCLVTRVHVCLDERVYNTLYTACKTGNLTAVQQILNDLKSTYGGSSQTVDAADAGETPADSDSVEVPTAVSRLLCHNESTTLLHAASQCGHVAIVRLLLHHGADPSIKYCMLSFHLYDYNTSRKHTHTRLMALFPGLLG